MPKQFTKDELIYALRGLDMKEFTIRELEFFNDLLRVKSKQIEREIVLRKAEGKID